MPFQFYTLTLKEFKIMLEAKTNVLIDFNPLLSRPKEETPAQNANDQMQRITMANTLMGGSN